MSDSASHQWARKGAVMALRATLSDRLLFSIAIISLIRAGEACAAEPAGTIRIEPERKTAPLAPAYSPSLMEFTKRYHLSDPLLTAPSLYGPAEIPETKTFSSTDFRPRGRSIFDDDARLARPDERLTADKDLGHRLAEFKNHNRVRVLTLWENGASAISLQTSHRGDPSLQWTSRVFNRGGATQGVLDRLFPVSVFGGTTHVTRSPTSQPSRISGALSSLHFGSSPPP